MKYKRILYTVLALLLALNIGFAASSRIIAEAADAEHRQYIAGLRLFVADTKEQAAADCRAAGCVCVDADLNAGNDEDAVVLGYCVTNDRSKAVTDITVLEMENGYTMVDYSSVAEEWMEKLTTVTSPLMSSLREYRKNLLSGSPEAVMAQELLNVYYVPEKNSSGRDVNTPLGDFLAGEDCGEDFLKRMICYCNTGVTYAVFNALACATADFDTETWAQRAASSRSIEQLEDIDFREMLDRTYNQDAVDCRQHFIAFSENVSKAKAYVAAHGMDKLCEVSAGTSANDVSGFGDVPQDTVDRLTGETRLDETENFLLYLLVYDILNQYRFNESYMLGDYIVRLGEQSFDSMEDTRELYPIIEAFTRGQRGVFRVVGFPAMAVALANNNDVLNGTREKINELTALMRDYTNGTADVISIYEGADLDIYDSKVALTNTANRAQHTSDEFDRLTEESDYDSFMREASSILRIAGLVTGLAYTVTQGITMGAAIYILGFSNFMATMGVAGVPVFGMCASAMTGMGVTALSSIMGLIGCTVVVAFYVALVAMIVLLVIEGIKWIVDMLTDEDDSIDYTYEDIPLCVYDYYLESYKKYTVVKDQYGRAGDLNAGEGRRFSALYTTCSPSAGSPIEVSELRDTFMVSSSPSNADGGYEAASYFGQGTAANLNAYSEENDAPDIYLFFNRAYEEKQQPVDDSGAESADEEYDRTSFGTYLLDIEVSCQRTQAAAKDKLIKQGFQVIDKNLTPSLEGKNGYYTYIGYRTTYNESDAITDIRVSPRNGGNEIVYGSAKYTRAGDCSPSGWGLYYTRNQKLGTPVYAHDLLVTDTPPDVSLGFEPVNMFCGGGAYNLNDTDDEDSMNYTVYENWNKSPVYIYFHPLVTFTDGPEYLGGLTFFYGKNTDDRAGDELAEYMKQCGYTKIGGNFSRGFEYSTHDFLFDPFSFKGSQVRNILTYLGYSVTHNPYRAIYDIKSFTTGGGASGMPPFLGTELTGGSAVCEVLFQLCPDMVEDDDDFDDFVRGTAVTHSYSNCKDAVLQTVSEDVVSEYPSERFDNALWKSTESTRYKSLYVQGPFGDKSPLMPCDIEVSSDARQKQMYADKGMYPVVDARIPNSTEPCSIALLSEYPQYMFVKKQVHQKKYIASVFVSSFSLERVMDKELYDELSSGDKEDYCEMADNSALCDAICCSADEVIPINLAVPYADSWQYDSDELPTEAAYLGVTRTDDPKQAVRSIILFRPQSTQEAASEIRIGNITYTRAGSSEPIHDKKTGYYVYYTTGSGCFPGEPITEISFDQLPMNLGRATALTAVRQDRNVTENVDGSVAVTTQYAELKGEADALYYLHSSFETTKTLISTLYVGTGATEKEAFLDLLNMGCCTYLPIDLNKNSAGNYVFLGYQRYTPTRTDSEAKANYAVRDIICTVGQEPQDSIKINGFEYKRISDRYNYDKSKQKPEDKGKAVSLNEGTNGKKIYMYYSTNKKIPECGEPIMEIAAHTRDFIPPYYESVPEGIDDEQKALYKNWECVLTTAGKRCNMNEGAYSRDKNEMVDNRVYLYVHRRDNTCKTGSVVTDGCTDTTMQYGSLKLH